VKVPVVRRCLSLLVGATLAVLVMAFAYSAVKELPVFGHPIMRVSQTYIDNGLGQTGAANLVSAVILNYRAYDTLGEAVVLFAAVVGALALLRSTGRKRGGVKEETR
jgi:multicomponent Na+:H+ antiporter subunit B